MDIKGFFDNLRHDLVLKALRHHTDLKWIHLYVERWLKAPLQREDGTLEERTAGTPQGGVISPLLANLFMHYAFDEWMGRNLSVVPFERYADDVVIHCVSQAQAEYVLEAVRRRLRTCGLELHPEKTWIVYCKDDRRRGDFEPHRFDFLGYEFRPRGAKGRDGNLFVGFLPAISTKSKQKIRDRIKGWKLARAWNNRTLEEIATLVNPAVRGWMAYYGRFYRSALHPVLEHLNLTLVRWAMRKHKRFRGKWNKAYHWLGGIAVRQPDLFVHWIQGPRPSAGR
jgi:RNA-directed DNA polymerase